jgi:site-specific DNA-adenine methylase
MVRIIRAAAPSDYSNYLELCAGIATVARKIADNHVPRTVVEKDHGQAELLKQVKTEPYELAERLFKLGYSRDVFEYALEMKTHKYYGCSSVETAMCRKILTDQSMNDNTINYRNIDKGADDDISLMIGAMKYRERYLRQIFPDCAAFSQEMQGITVIEGDMFDYLNRLCEPELWCTVDPPYRPDVRNAGMKGYDEDWEESTHLKLMEELYNMYLNNKLKAKVLICCYVDLDDMQGDVYCRYLMRMGFKLYLLQDVYRPTINSDQVKMKHKSRATECVFINYEPVAGDIVEPERMFTYEDVFGDKIDLCS